MSSNSLSFTNVKDGIFNNIYLINEDGGVDNVKDLLGSSSSTPSANPTFTGNVGINTTTADSALHIVGSKEDNPTTVGIRMGKSSNFSTDATESYGIEICSDTYTTGGSYIDFTYPYSLFPASYAGGMFFDNNNGYFAWNNNWSPSATEAIATPYQMQLDKDGNLTVQNKLTVPAISLDGRDSATILQTISSTTNPTFTESLTVQNLSPTGTSNIYLKTNNSTRTARLYMDETGSIKLDNNNDAALEVYPNGVLSNANKIQNKVLNLYDLGTSDNPVTTTNFYGLGINDSTLRYQVPSTSNNHKLYCGNTLALDVGGSSSSFAGSLNTTNLTVTGSVTIPKRVTSYRSNNKFNKHLNQ